MKHRIRDGRKSLIVWQDKQVLRLIGKFYEMPDKERPPRPYLLATLEEILVRV